jgi:hypothetical protein
MPIPGLVHLIRNEVRWLRTTGDSADDQINTFFTSSNVDDRQALLDASVAFIASFRTFIDGLMPSALFTSAPLLHYLQFDMLEAEPRAAVAEGDAGAGALSGSQPLPEECSMVLTLDSPHVSGQSQRRRRGRMYLPTFTVDALDATTSTIWDQSVIDVVTTWIPDAIAALEDADCNLVIFSRVEAAEDGGTLLQQARAGATVVTRGWVDNEPDTQRRRGRDGGTRSAWSVA